MDVPAREILAVAAPGTEALVARECASLGWIDPRTVPGGVVTMAHLSAARVACLCARLPAGVRVRVGTCPATTLEALASGIRTLAWGAFVHPGQEVEVSVTSRSSRLQRREAVARKAAYAIQDAVRGPRHPLHRPPPPAPVHLRLEDDRALLSMDAAGTPLFQRGWRASGGGAPLRENLAAVMLAAAGWQPGEPVVDPFCGSGTLLIEAAQVVLGIPPGQGRTFAFESWPCHDARAWRREQEAARGTPVPSPPLLGTDQDPEAVRRAIANARLAGVSGLTRFEVARVDASAPGDRRGLVVANPPWGLRLGRDVGGVWVAFGRVLRERFSGWRVAVLCPDAALVRLMGLSLQPLVGFPHGGVRVAVWTGSVGPAGRTTCAGRTPRSGRRAR
jgi:putative N6-adenine-specific DNA methylase